MMRLCIGLALLLGSVAPAWADVPGPTVAPDAIEDAADEARFTALAAKGDRERAAGRLPEAAIAYAQALGLRGDPLVAGRLGVLLVKLGRPEQAAELLLDAIQRASKTTREERQGFLRAYDEAMAQGCWVEVVISHAHTRVTLDGRSKNRAGHSAFFVFVMAGEHEVRASLEGYQDAAEKFTAIKGTDMRVPLTLRPLPSAEPLETLFRKRAPDPLGSIDEPGVVDEPPPREPIYGGVEGEPRRSKVRGFLGVGPVAVLGVASWYPAVGAALSGGVRLNEYVSINADARAAWLTSGVAGEQSVSAMTAGGLLHACGHWRWLFGCLTGHLGVIKLDIEAGTYKPTSSTDVKAGMGGRAGVLFPIGDSFALQAAADAVGLSSGTSLLVGRSILVDQPAVLISAGVTGIWEF
ncbi:hypothetical protein [Polyangium aurulentum]|uniref:hypothetical protein n=1 Tax=Polyangium aurulentum TaxID=2567896 RepID=UPI0010AEA819|nr:hypothetical protein [Polyangium aurulentum]UQA60399.1 hypothetical protein E8A73_007970 [Polyangium aurulentum]